MSDNLGAAPYAPPPALSVWERIEAWWFGPTVTPEDIRRDVAAMSEDERDALMPDYLKRRIIDRRVRLPARDGKADLLWSIARAAGRTAALAGRRYERPPPKNGGPSHPPTPVFE